MLGTKSQCHYIAIQWFDSSYPEPGNKCNRVKYGFDSDLQCSSDTTLNKDEQKVPFFENEYYTVQYPSMK